MNTRQQIQRGKYLLMGLGTLVLALGTGCEPPSDEEPNAYWESDADMTEHHSSEAEVAEGETGFLDGVKADSGMSEENRGKKKTKKWSVHRSDQRPLIGNEAIGHGTPQPWNPTDPNNDSAEEDSQ